MSEFWQQPALVLSSAPSGQSRSPSHSQCRGTHRVEPAQWNCSAVHVLFSGEKCTQKCLCFIKLIIMRLTVVKYKWTETERKVWLCSDGSLGISLQNVDVKAQQYLHMTFICMNKQIIIPQHFIKLHFSRLTAEIISQYVYIYTNIAQHFYWTL